MWLHLPLIESLVSSTSTMFPEVHYATTQIPTYPCGQIGLLQLQKDGDATTPTASPKNPPRVPAKDMQLKYYSTELHTASFTLPQFITSAIQKAKARAS